jgi:hypothetical protein
VGSEEALVCWLTYHPIPTVPANAQISHPIVISARARDLPALRFMATGAAGSATALFASSPS